MNYSRRILIFVVCVFLVFAVAYLASNPVSNSKEALSQKVHKEWEARANTDWGVVYDMTTDEFKKKVRRDMFITRANIRVEKFSVKEVEVLESGKEGRAVIDYTMNQMGFKFDTTVKEKWVWKDGEWRLNLAAIISPFGKN